jgi:predicted ATPase
MLSIGRVSERERLERFVRTPEGSSVVVVGPAGIGKTTLVNDAATTLREDGTTVLRGRAEDALESQFNLWRRPAHDLGIELPQRDQSIVASEPVWELTALLRDALVAASPVVVVLDDLHRAAPTSLAVLRHLADEVSGDRVALLSATREPESPKLVELVARSVVMRLGPLTRLETGQLATALTGVQVDGDELDRLYRSTGGNPLLVGEVVQGSASLALLAARGAAGEALESTLLRAGQDALDTLSVLAVGAPASRSRCSPQRAAPV